jgi:peptide/nickel transport system permease protein
MATLAPASSHTLPRRESVWRRLARNPSAAVGGALVGFFVVMALAAPWLAPYDPVTTNWLALRKPPSAAYWLGTDELGRDILSRILWGARASLLAGALSVALALAIGVPLGVLSGYVGGWVDMVLMRVTDGLLAIPFLILAIAMAAFLGPSLQNAMLAIGIAAVPIFMRLARGEVIAAREEDYVDAARACGYGHVRIALRHIFPNTVPPLIVQATLTAATAIIAEASLSFLGLGQQPPAPSWGSSLNAARQFITQAPWMSLWPGLAICLAVFGLNLLGDGLRDVLDPKE